MDLALQEAIVTIGFEKTVQALADTALKEVRLGSQLQTTSLDMSKKKLNVYYALMQKDVMKTRAAMNAFRDVATSVLAAASDATIMGVAIATQKAEVNIIHEGVGNMDENTRQLAATLKRSYDAMEILLAAIST